MQLLEEIRKLRLNRTPHRPPYWLKRRRNRNPSPLSRAISALTGPVSWTIEGGAWHFWKSEEQPVKASQHLSQRRNWSNGGRRVGCAGISYNSSISKHRRCMPLNRRRHEAPPSGLGKLKQTATRPRYVFGGISHL